MSSQISQRRKLSEIEIFKGLSILLNLSAALQLNMIPRDVLSDDRLSEYNMG